MKIKTFVFNSFQVNTYLISSLLGDTLIIDPACYSDAEQNELTHYVEKEGLNIKMAINTHGHIDHILGNQFTKNLFKCPVFAHKDSEIYFKQAPSYASIFSLDGSNIGFPDAELHNGQEIVINELKLEILYTPGHAEGSVCVYLSNENTLFSGDVLFHGGIGRTDLPGGNYNLLINSIKSELFLLPDETIVYPGHGSSTSIGEEKKNNPFL